MKSHRTSRHLGTREFLFASFLLNVLLTRADAQQSRPADPHAGGMALAYPTLQELRSPGWWAERALDEAARIHDDGIRAQECWSTACTAFEAGRFDLVRRVIGMDILSDQDQETLAFRLESAFEQAGDVERVGELAPLLRTTGFARRDAYETMVRIYIARGDLAAAEHVVDTFLKPGERCSSYLMLTNRAAKRGDLEMTWRLAEKASQDENSSASPFGVFTYIELAAAKRDEAAVERGVARVLKITNDWPVEMKRDALIQLLEHRKGDIPPSCSHKLGCPPFRLWDVPLSVFNLQEALDDKLSILDIKARDKSGRQFNIEMQMLGYPDYEKRVVYYWAKFHQQQLHEGDDYRVLRPTISISFLNHVLFPQVPDHHLRFHLLEDRHHFAMTEDIEFHVLELPKFTKTLGELESGLDIWLYFLRFAEKIDAGALLAALQQPSILRAVEELKMLTQTDIERERYEARRKAQLDYNSGMNSARRQGQMIGEKIGAVHAYERMLRRAETPEEQLLALSLENLQRLAEDLEKQLLMRQSG